MIKPLLSSIYAKISAIFLMLLIVLGLAQFFVFFQFSTRFMQESDQKLNLNLAENLAEKFAPLLKDSIHVHAIEQAFHDMMVMNPRVEFYLLDMKGNILAYFADPTKIKLNKVSLEPIRTFLDPEKRKHLPILGDDPRGEGRKKPISVARIELPDHEEGYLYVILGGEDFDSAVAMLKNSYILKSATMMLVLNIILTAIVGMLLFFILTRRIQIVNKVVKEFEKGNFHARVEMNASDEIGQLARTYNKMAETIQRNIEEIKTADRLRRELVANISHDLRSPLASVLGYLETILLKDSTLSPDKRKEFLEIIYRNLKRLNKLVYELFELSKFDAGQVEVRTEPFSIAELCQDIILKFKPLAEKRKVNVYQKFDENISMARGDIGLIERAISNLLDNALNYTPENGSVTLILEEKDNQIIVRISDTGTGISPQDIPHIFDRFYRVDKSRTAQSTGLGLAITRKIIEAHHSNIKVWSEMDKGTTFEFALEKAR